MSDVYVVKPVQIVRNKRLFGSCKGKSYWRFGMGARWVVKRDGTRRYLGWSFFIGPYRLTFGKKSFFAEVSAL